MRILILACAAMAMGGTAGAEQLTAIPDTEVGQWRTEGPVQCTNPCPPDATRSWHLLTQSYGGTISLLKDLTKHECEFAMHRAKGEPANEEEVVAAKNAMIDRAIEIEKAKQDPTFCQRTGGSPACGGMGADGSAATSSRMIMPDDMKLVECFQ